MEPVKFEDNIREELQEREIVPSTDAWEKLASRLDSKPQKRIRRSIWLSLAAGFTGILIVVSFFFKDTASPIQTSPTLVKKTPQVNDVVPAKNDSRVVNNVKKAPSNKIPAGLQTNKQPKTHQNSVKESIATNNNTSKTLKSKAPIKENTAFSAIDNTEQNTLTKPNQEEAFINTKVEEVVAQVQSLQNKNNTVSASEIDALLLAAQRNINLSRVKNKKVNATALLNVVEFELETSFRDKVFEALGEGFEKVRTAVVERNN